MTLKTKIFGGFFTVAFITVAVAAIGFWQTQKLAAALNQVGIVQLPSVQALDAILEAQSTLDASKRELLHEATVFENDSDTNKPLGNGPLASSSGGPKPVLTWAAWSEVLQEELRLQQKAWERAEKGWKAYDSLLRTPEEETQWKDFTAAWNTWRAGYEKVMARLSRAHTTGDRSLLTTAREENYNHLYEPTQVSHQLLTDLLESNERSTATSKQQSVTSQQDVQLVGYFMLAAAIASVVTAIGCGIFLSRLISRPIRQLAGAFTQIARGDLNTRLPVGSRDELGQLSDALNRMVASLHLGELRFRAVFENFPAAVSISKKSHLVLVTPALPEMFGYESTEAVIGRPVFDFIAPEDRAFLLERIRLHDRDQALASVYELTGLRKDGTKFTLEVESAFFTFQGENYTVDLQRDITGRNPAPERL
jgi:PAS domain S-box-containing protein